MYIHMSKKYVLYIVTHTSSMRQEISIGSKPEFLHFMYTNTYIALPIFIHT